MHGASICSLGTAPSQDLSVFTSPEDHQITLFKSFIELNLQPPSFLEVSGWLKVPTLQSLGLFSNQPSLKSPH